MRNSILYHRKDTAAGGTQVGRHRHDFWQIEWIASGEAEFWLPGGRRRLVGGKSLFIPPGEEHAIRYRKKTAYLSIKFVLADSEQTLSPLTTESDDDFLAGVLEALYGILPDGDWLPERTRRRTEYLLSGLLGGCADRSVPRGQTENATPSSTPVTRVQALLETTPTPPRSVKVLATRLGYSPNYLASAYRAAKGFSLKHSLDRETQRRAAALLAYSEKSIGQIADELGFPDIFGFSRFFRRMSGINPRAYRQQVSEDRKIVPEPAEPPRM